MFIGTPTAVGGAVIRDVLLAQRADIVQPGPYNAVAALIGATALTVLAGPLGLDPLPVAAAVIVLVAALRVLSVWRGWEAPVAVDLPGRTRDRLGRRRRAAVAQASVPASGITSGAGSMLGGTICRPASGGRGSSCGCSRTREHRDVVLGIGQEQPLEHLVAQLVERQAGALAEHLDQLGGTRVEVAVAALDQTVGVEQHRRARARGR